MNKILLSNFNYLSFLLPKYLPIQLNINKNSYSHNIQVYTLIKYLLNICFFLKKHTYTQFNILNDIIVYDVFTKKIRFKIIYYLRSILFNISIEIFIILDNIKKNFILPSSYQLYYSSFWIENEIWDLYGIYFFNNKNLSRILTDYGFMGFPLRKDFPLTGYKELKFNIQNKLLYYIPIELIQEFRMFNLRNLLKFK